MKKKLLSFADLKLAQRQGSKAIGEKIVNKFRYTDGTISIQPTSGYDFNDKVKKTGKVYSDEASDYKWSYLTFMFQDSTGQNRSLNLSPKIFMEAVTAGFIGEKVGHVFVDFCEKYPNLVEV